MQAWCRVVAGLPILAFQHPCARFGISQCHRDAPELPSVAKRKHPFCYPMCHWHSRGPRYHFRPEGFQLDGSTTSLRWFRFVLRVSALQTEEHRFTRRSKQQTCPRACLMHVAFERSIPRTCHKKPCFVGMARLKAYISFAFPSGRGTLNPKP